MTGNSDTDLRALMADWQSAPAPAAPADKIRAYVARRGRLLAAWAAFDTLLGTAFLVFLIHRAVTHPDPIEKLAMGLLAAIAAATMAFAWWNLLGTLRPSADDTRTFVALSVERSRRFARNLRAAWGVLAAQAAVFTPWVYHQLYGGGRVPEDGRELFAWGFLAFMLAGAAALVVALQAWARRDAAAFEQIRRELTDEP
jgi:hypothetical protein